MRDSRGKSKKLKSNQDKVTGGKKDCRGQTGGGTERGETVKAARCGVPSKHAHTPKGKRFHGGKCQKT